jgi:LacI family transcriptional regulator
MNPSLARVMAKRRIPLIDLNDWYRGLGFPQIVSDMEAIGALGAEHLIERGFRNLAFCGFSGELWCNERQAGFARVAREHGGNLCGTYATPWADLRAHPWQVERDWIARWLRTLPRPLGVMACNDVRGQHVLDACAQIKASVPDEIAVVGVDNSEPFCELCSPPLSSVVPNAERIGYEAAALLDGWLRGEKVEPITRKILPLNVVARQSTDTLAIEDLPIAAPLVTSASTPATGCPWMRCCGTFPWAGRCSSGGSANTSATRPRKKSTASGSNASSNCWPKPTGNSTGSPTRLGSSIRNT